MPSRPTSGPRGDRSRQRRLARGLLGLVVSVVSLVAVIAWALRQDTPDFPATPGHLALVGLAIAVYALATLTRGWRWGVLR